MISKTPKNQARLKRHMRIRRRMQGSSERPRLCIYRSNKHIYAQIVDDTKAHTLVAASSLDNELTDKLQKTWNKDSAQAVGELIAKRALKKQIDAVVFDRGGYIYHGRIAAVADAARQAGLKF